MQASLRHRGVRTHGSKRLCACLACMPSKTWIARTRTSSPNRPGFPTSRSTDREQASAIPIPSSSRWMKPAAAPSCPSLVGSDTERLGMCGASNSISRSLATGTGGASYRPSRSRFLNWSAAFLTCYKASPMLEISRFRTSVLPCSGVRYSVVWLTWLVASPTAASTPDHAGT